MLNSAVNQVDVYFSLSAVMYLTTRNIPHSTSRSLPLVEAPYYSHSPGKPRSIQAATMNITVGAHDRISTYIY